MASRFYLPSTVGAPVTPTLGTGWEVTTSYTTHPTFTTKSNSALATGTARAKGSAVSNDDRLDRVYVSEPIAAQTITGTFSAVLAAIQSSATADYWLQIMLRVLSGDGTTVRGTLYAGSTAVAESATVGNEAEEYSTSFATRIKSAITVSSVAALAGDRISIEIGARGNGTTTTDTFTHKYGDPTASADYALTSGLTTTIDSWVELSQTLTFMPKVDAGVDAGNRTGQTFSRTATETLNGATVTSRAWTIVSGPAGSGSTIGTAAALSWTPATAGDYVLRYTLVTSAGTVTDDVAYTASAGAYVAGITLMGAAGAVSSTMTGTAPAGTAAGDLLLAVFSFAANSNTVTGQQTVTGYTNIQSTQLTGGNSYGQSMRRIADGTAADNFSVAWTDWNNTGNPGTTQGAGFLILIKGAAASGTILEASAVTSASTANIDPASLTPTGGAKDYLWLCPWYGATAVQTTGPPATFLNYNTRTGTTTAISAAAFATRYQNVASLDPGAWSNAAASCATQTFAIHPAVASGTAYSRSGGVSATAAVAGSRRQASARSGGVASPATGAASRTRTLRFTGGVAAAGALAGSRTITHSYSGGVAAAAVVAAARTRTLSFSGGVTAPATAAATHSVRRVFSGGVVSPGVLAGSRAQAITRTGGASSPGVLAGTRTRTSDRSGTVAAPGAASGSRSMAFARTAGAAAPAVLSGSRGQARFYTGGVTTPAALAGSRTRTLPFTGGVASPATSAGSRAVAQSRTGGVSSAATLAGTRVRTLARTGGVAAAGTLAGTRAVAEPRTGGVAAPGVSAGSRAQATARSGGVATAAVLAGSRAGGLPRSGAIAAEGVLAGSRQQVVVRTGGAAAACAVSGSRAQTVHRSGGVTSAAVLAGSHSAVTIRSGGVAAGAVLAGSRSQVVVRSGAAAAGVVVAGTRTVAVYRTGGITAAGVLAGSGLGAGPPPVTRTGGVASAAAISGHAQIAHNLTGGVAGAATLAGSRTAVRTRTGGVSAPATLAGELVFHPAHAVLRSGGIVVVAVLRGSGYAVAAEQPALVVGGSPRIRPGPSAGSPTATPAQKAGIPRVPHRVVAGQPRRRRV